MRINSFHIQGFKSLADVKVESLSDINVFYGLNNVGKSNIFQALDLWNQLLPSITLSTDQLEGITGASLFQLGGDNLINLEISLHLSGNFDETAIVKIINRENMKSRYPAISYKDLKPDDKPDDLDKLLQGKITLNSKMQIVTKPGSKEANCQVDLLGETETGYQVELELEDLPQKLPSFHVIRASRRLQAEMRGESKDLGSISDYNLKQALFYAYLSRDLQQKNRLAAIKRILSSSPFNLGDLDIALDRDTDQIDIGFVRSDGRLPLENMGSGVQQLLLVLGQIFLNDYPIIAIEEPEMNLSPQYQQYLLVALRKLMQDPAVKLDQLFISTHSPYFEFEENFFDVTMDEQGATQVIKLPMEKRSRYFPETRVGEETSSRLNSLNQITLYDGVIKDLGLERGDLVLFAKNDTGRWEIRTENEIAQELEAIFGDQD